MSKVTVWLAAASIAGAALSAEPARAGDETWKKDRFYVSVGLYRPNFDTRIRVDETTTGISGTLLNLEQDLELNDRKSQVTFDGHLRIAKRHAVEFEYVKLNRRDETRLTVGVEYDGEFFGIDEEVSTTFNTEVARLAYRFSFLNNRRTELSAALGLHVTDLKVGLNVIGEEEDLNEVTAPLPTLGGSWKYHFNDAWTFHVRGEWLDLKVDNVKGSLSAGLAEVTWYPVRNLGLGLGYHIWELDVSATEDSLTGSIKYRYDGPRLSLNARF